MARSREGIYSISGGLQAQTGGFTGYPDTNTDTDMPTLPRSLPWYALRPRPAEIMPTVCKSGALIQRWLVLRRASEPPGRRHGESLLVFRAGGLCS
jgi:hypothetical protein